MSRPAMATLLIALSAGSFLAGVLAGRVRRSPAPPPAAPTARPPSDPAAERDLRDRLDEANRRIETLERESREFRDAARTESAARAQTPAPPPEDPKEGPEVPLAELRETFTRLSKMGLMALYEDEFRQLIRRYKEHGPAAVQELLARLESEKSGERFAAAAILEAIGDPAAIPGLARSLQTDKDLLVRRMTSRALATIGNEAAADPLRGAMNGDEDWGVRVNSAYGLAKLDLPDGVARLKEAYQSKETPPEMVIAILGGMSDVAHPTYAPVFKEILTTQKELSYLLLAISGLEKMKEAASIPDLQRVADSDAYPDNVRDAARKAVEALSK